MKGAGTDDATLIRCVVSRSEVRPVFSSRPCLRLNTSSQKKNVKEIHKLSSVEGRENWTW